MSKTQEHLEKEKNSTFLQTSAHDTRKEQIKLSSPVLSYPDEVISRGITFINGNRPIDNAIDISFALCNLVMGCEDIDEPTKDSYNCLYSYLGFQFELLKGLVEND